MEITFWLRFCFWASTYIFIYWTENTLTTFWTGFWPRLHSVTVFFSNCLHWYCITTDCRIHNRYVRSCRRAMFFDDSLGPDQGFGLFCFCHFLFCFALRCFALLYFAFYRDAKDLGSSFRIPHHFNPNPNLNPNPKPNHYPNKNGSGVTTSEGEADVSGKKRQWKGVKIEKKRRKDVKGKVGNCKCK